jgi:hypothetical protein
MEDTKNPPSRGLIMIPPSDHVLHMPLWFLESLGHAPRRVWLRPLASSWLQIIISLKRRSSIRSMCKSPKFKNTSHGIPGHLRVHILHMESPRAAEARRNIHFLPMDPGFRSMVVSRTCDCLSQPNRIFIRLPFGLPTDTKNLKTFVRLVIMDKGTKYQNLGDGTCSLWKALQNHPHRLRAGMKHVHAVSDVWAL